jgi:hypothetical protein
MFLVIDFGQRSFQSGQHRHVACAQRQHKSAVYRVLIDVDLDQAHGRSAPVLPFELFGEVLFGFQIGVDLGLIGVVIGEGGMHLRK